jgi:hypothetical protein
MAPVDSFGALWRARWQGIQAGTWIPHAGAVAQWTLVACAAIATTLLTAGYLSRVPRAGKWVANPWSGSTSFLNLWGDLGPVANWAFDVGSVAAFTGWFVVTPVTWALLWRGRRHPGGDAGGAQRRRDVWFRIWWLVLSVLAPPLAGAFVPGQHALAAVLLPVFLYVPGTAVILWLIGRMLGVDSWFRRICFRVGLISLVLELVVPRFDFLPAWLTGELRAGAVLGLSQAELWYLRGLMTVVIGFGFVVLGSMILASRPVVSTVPIIMTPPLPPPPAPVAQPSEARADAPRDVELPRHPSGRVIRRLDV